jgi:hypothetical protein
VEGTGEGFCNISDRANSRVGAVNSRLRDAVCEGWGILSPFAEEKSETLARAIFRRAISEAQVRPATSGHRSASITSAGIRR